METLLWLLVAHAYFDYAGQGDWLSKAKNHRFVFVTKKGLVSEEDLMVVNPARKDINSPIYGKEYVPRDNYESIWFLCMASHCIIHAGAVFFITNSWICGIVEFVAHFCTDWLKNNGRLTYNQDQTVHIAFKFWFAFWLFYCQYNGLNLI
jgi:hypothetical protein